jgi:hypothetical protein
MSKKLKEEIFDERLDQFRDAVLEDDKIKSIIDDAKKRFTEIESAHFPDGEIKNFSDEIFKGVITVLINLTK